MVPRRDANFTRGRGYLRIPDPMGKGTGKKFYQGVRIRAVILARGKQTGIHTRIISVTY
jgi:hypothetical protein